MAHGNGGGNRGANVSRAHGHGRGHGARTGGCGGGGCGCGGCGGGGWGWAPPCGGWGGCGWGGGCGGYCGGPQIVPMPVPLPWPYPMAVPQQVAPVPNASITGCALGGPGTGCAMHEAAQDYRLALASLGPHAGTLVGTGAFGDRLAAAFPVLGNVREAADSVRDLMSAVRTARDALKRVRGSFAALVPAAAAPAATPFEPAAASGPLATCPDRSCVVYELRALNDASGQPVRTAQVPDRTPIEVIGDTTGVIMLEGASPRRWSHVRLRATDGSTIEGWMKPENLNGGAPPSTGFDQAGTSTGCACEKLVPTSTGQLMSYQPGQQLRLHRNALSIPLNVNVGGGNPILVFRVVRDRGDSVIVDLVATSDGDTTSPFEGGRFTFTKSAVASGLAMRVGSADYYRLGSYYRSQGNIPRAQRYEAVAHVASAREKAAAPAAPGSDPQLEAARRSIAALVAALQLQGGGTPAQREQAAQSLDAQAAHLEASGQSPAVVALLRQASQQLRSGQQPPGETYQSETVGPAVLLQAITAKEAEVAARTNQLAAVRAQGLPPWQVQMFEQYLLRAQGELQALREAYARGNA